MKIAILSRNRKLHSIRRLLEEAKAKQVRCDIINPLDCQVVVAGKRSEIITGTQPLPRYDIIFPRIGASITSYGLIVVKQFEMLGIPVINPSDAIDRSRNKMKCAQVLATAGIPVPMTVMTRSTRRLHTAVQAARGLPVVLKVPQGTQGIGVMLVHAPITLASVIETLRNFDQDVMIQEYIAEGAGTDYRALVIGNRVVAAMRRTAVEGDFRTNIHRGGEGKLVQLPAQIKQLALKATKAVGLQIAGVDIMEGRDGPLVIEINSSPGFEGIEKATGLNIASEMIKQLITSAKSSRKRRSPSLL